MENVSLSKLPVPKDSFKILQYTILGLVLFVLIQRQAKAYREWLASQKAGSDPNSAFAIRIRQAVNPSGIDWLIDIDTTLEGDLMVIADEISDVDKVARAYYDLYGENLVKRLEKELNSTKYAEWSRRANTPPTKTQDNSFDLGKEVAAIRDTPIFSETDSSDVLWIAKSGSTLGRKVKAYKMTVNGKSQYYWLIEWDIMLVFKKRGFVLMADTKEV